ncbi:MAG: hypothetical protein KKA12_15520, partial [Alphaproteobacteria bacterium]|nr:hypothetical protein [Alphaproteobacteria bacterium]
SRIPWTGGDRARELDRTARPKTYILYVPLSGILRARWRSPCIRLTVPGIMLRHRAADCGKRKGTGTRPAAHGMMENLWFRAFWTACGLSISPKVAPVRWRR